MRKLRKGTSIIEAAIAIALIGIILLWSITAYTNISTQSKTSEDIEIASTLASDRIEYLKTLKYSTEPGFLQNEINVHKDSITWFDDTSKSKTPYYPGFGYKYVVPETINVNTVTVSNPQGDNPDSDFYLITITVNIYKKPNVATPIIQMDCNFLRDKSDGTNAGI